MSNVILRNSLAEQYLCAARKKFYLREGILSESSSKLLFCHFSDLHGDWKRLDNLLEMIREYCPEFAIHTGDLVCWDSQDASDPFFEAVGKVDIPVYNCIGNHETFRGEDVLSNEYLHHRYIAPTPNIHSIEKGYYYADIPGRNLRLIVLNVYENDQVEHHNDRHFEVKQEQCDWLVAVLKDCEAKGLDVMIASHEIDDPVQPGSNHNGFCQRFEPHPWGPPYHVECHVVSDIVDAFQNGRSIKKDYQWQESGNRIHIDCTFSKRSTFICYLNGHRHGDYIGYLPNYPGQLSMGITCCGCFPERYHNIGDEVSDLPRIPETISEDAVNFCVLDQQKREITVVRVGACVNDLLESRISARYTY